VKRIGAALIGALLGVALLAYLSGPSALATGRSGTTTFTLTAGTSTSSAVPFTFQQGVAYDITVSNTITYNFTNSSPPTTCVRDVFYDECSQTGTPPGSWQRQDLVEVFDDPHNPNSSSYLPGEPFNTVTYHSNHSYSWVVPASVYGKTTTKYFWAVPYGQPETYTTTYSGQITVSITPHVQQNRFGVRFSAIGLPNNPPGGLKDVTLAGSGRVQLEEYADTQGASFQGPATVHVTDVEYVQLGSGPQKKRKPSLAETGGHATLQNLKNGGQLIYFQGLKVTDSDDPNCEKGLSTATLHVRDSPSQPDTVVLLLHCESAHTQHVFYFQFTNGPHTHVTTAIVGPQ
jgi:hypothetical protein